MATEPRLGIVMAVDKETRRARVKFPDVDMVSDYLPVLANQPYIPAYEGTQRTEYQEGGSGEAAYARHYHELKILPWLPKVNDLVLVVYVGGQDGDGIIVGGVIPWQ